MRPVLFSLLALTASAAYAQTSEQWSRGVCDILTPEEMKICLATPPNDRNARCDELAPHQMEMCLQDRRDEAPASAGATGRKETGKSDRTPEKAATPREGTK
jgi:hypothetical protein